MPVEKEMYRDNLERVMAAFPRRELIPVQEAAGWLGLDPRRLYQPKGSPCKKIGGRYYVTVVALARWLA